MLKTYTHPNGTPYKKMGGPEYCDALDVVFAAFAAAAPQSSTRAPLILWHDHDTAHLAMETQHWLQRRGVAQVVGPVRSPDLSPLDYGVFGTAKNKLRRHMSDSGAAMPWAGQAAWLLKELHSTDTKPIIEALPDRLAACVSAGGGHIEGLAPLREARKHGREEGAK